MKFSTVDLTGLYNQGVEGLGAPWHTDLIAQLGNLPAGAQTFWGIPFALAEAGGPRWLELAQGTVTLPLREPTGTATQSATGDADERGRARSGPRSSAFIRVQSPVQPERSRVSYVLVAHFCNASVNAAELAERPDLQRGFVTRPGEKLADYVLVYADGAEHRQAIRRRFEINEPLIAWGQLPFAAQPHTPGAPVDLHGPYTRNAWGRAQTAVDDGHYGLKYWVYALANPHPEKELAAIRFEPSGTDRLAIAGVTLYHGEHHPLQHRRLSAFRVLLPPEEAALPEQVQAEVDLGIIARKYAVPAFDPERWLQSDLQGWGEPRTPPAPTRDLRLEISASPEATLTVNGHPIDLAQICPSMRAQSRDGAVRIEMLDGERTWVHVTVEDATTGKPTPVRVHFRTPDGRYLPPYGHRREVNANWFEDYGADLKLGSTEYAYVDGRFQIELPAGEVYVEAAKGFEYRSLRQRLEIKPGQRELTLRLERPLNLRAQGWVTADTHVHFISPQTAWLEAQGEGLNLVNLLASQWGDLFTNVGDITGGLSGVSTSDTLVWVGTENRQHILGHMSLLGVRGEPIYPMTTSGPSESYLGDPTECSLAEWADRCRAQEGVVVLPHFPNPHLEAAADIILGKIDGVEIRYFSPNLDNYHLGEWYRCLNLGYRLTAVGGTDKMFASMPVGGVRTYAHLGDEEFTFANWGKAVRAGRTFTTSGPLIGLTVEGRVPGDEIRLPAGGGTLEVEAWMQSLQPVHELHLVVNGRVVERAVEPNGAGQIRLRTKVRLPGSAWIAARCASRLQVWHEWPIHVAAHTSPVYVVAGGQELFNPSDATFMLTLLDGGLTYLDTLSIPASAEKHERIKAVFRAAQAELHRRLHAHGVQH